MPSWIFPMTTAATAGALGILQIVLMVYIGLGRAKFRTGLGDGGHDALNRRIRMHGNLTENAPLFLVLLGLAETSGFVPGLVRWLGPLVVLCRIIHVFGLSLWFGPGPNPLRAIGATGTLIGIGVLAVSLLWVALPRLM